MAGPYTRLTDGESADTGAQAIVTVVNEIEVGLEEAEVAIASQSDQLAVHADELAAHDGQLAAHDGELADQAALIAGKSDTSHAHTGTYDPAGSAASAQAAAVQRANHTGTQAASTISNFDTQVRTNRLDQMAAPTTAVGMGSQRITGVGTPTASTDATTKAYVDTAVGAATSGFLRPEDYGAVGDGGVGVGFSISGTTLTAFNDGAYTFDAPFVSGDVGKTIWLQAIDFSGAAVSRTISAVAANGQSCTLSSGLPWSVQTQADWGGTDDTAAIQAALDAAKTAGLDVVLGPKQYKVTDTLSIPAGVTLRGQGWSWLTPSGSRPAVSTRLYMAKSVTADKGLLKFANSTEPAHGAGVADLWLCGQFTAGCTKPVLEANGISGTPMFLYNGRIENVYVTGGYNGISTSYSSTLNFYDVLGGNCRSHVYYFGALATDHVARNMVGGNSGKPIFYVGSDHNIFDNCTAEYGTIGWTIAGRKNVVTGIVSTFTDSGVAISGDYNNVNVKCGNASGSGTTGFSVSGDGNTVAGTVNAHDSGALYYGVTWESGADGNTAFLTARGIATSGVRNLSGGSTNLAYGAGM